jgi:hypothetical protein
MWYTNMAAALFSLRGWVAQELVRAYSFLVERVWENSQRIKEVKSMSSVYGSPQRGLHSLDSELAALP